MGSELKDLDAIRERLSLGVYYSPAMMRADIVFMLQAFADLHEVINAAMTNPETAAAVDHATLALMQKHLRQANADLEHKKEINALMQTQITNLQKWLRERCLVTDEQMSFVMSIGPREILEFLKKEKPLPGASE